MPWRQLDVPSGTSGPQRPHSLSLSERYLRARNGANCRDARADGITHIAFGDLFLDDERAYREETLAGTGITILFPLRDCPTATLATQMIPASLTDIS